MNVIILIPPSPDYKKIVRMIDCSHETKANYLWQPNDFLIISSLLKSEDKVTFIDGTADSLSEKQFIKEVSAIKNADILFFALSSVCWHSDYEYFKSVKSILPEVPTFVIGDIFIEQKYQELILKDCDGIVFQPYELELDKMILCKQSNFESLPGVAQKPGERKFDGKKEYKTNNRDSFPRHEIFQKSGYSFPFAKHFRHATVTTMWGCPFSCSYCTDSQIAPVVRPYENIVNELEYLSNLGIKELFIADKTFGFPYKNAFPLLEEMAKRFSFSWCCYHHPQLYNPKLLEMMKAAGCHTIIIGIDSVNFESLETYNRKVKQNKVEELVNHANKLGMSICADFIFGLEHEDEEDINKTIEYSLKLPIDFASFNIAAPLPGSSIRKKAIEEGRIKLGEEGFDTLGNKEVLGNDKISSQKLSELRKNAIRRFYMRPSYIWRRLRRTTSFEHFMVQFTEMISMFRKT